MIIILLRERERERGREREGEGEGEGERGRERQRDREPFPSKFNEEIKVNQLAVRSTVYVTREGRGNLLSYETAMELGCVPEIGQVNEMGEIPPVKTTDRYSKLCEEYNDIYQDIETLKCLQFKINIEETVQ